jgi:hypothetical protein
MSPEACALLHLNILASPQTQRHRLTFWDQYLIARSDPTAHIDLAILSSLF